MTLFNKKLALIWVITAFSVSRILAVSPQDPVKVPVRGNTWYENEYHGSFEGPLHLSGQQGWMRTFVRFSESGELSLKLSLTVERPGALRIRIGDLKQEFSVRKIDTLLDLGSWNLTDSGYQCIEVCAIKGGVIGDLKDYYLEGAAVSGGLNFVQNNEGNFFYWGRRGPSTHLNYQVPEGKDIAYYYNEITVPAGNDVVGSYFMATGFSGGYFGIQVNADKERRVLFSVWSPFQTDDPSAIPEGQRIKLQRKGPEVNAGEFGNEGSGGQSFLQYNWKAENTYRFLLKGQPVEDDYTNYTAWFFAPEEGKWRLIASFSRPKTNSWLKGFHSFLENFDPRQGILTRKAYFSNQWVKTTEGEWLPIQEARFSADNTARKGYRMDYQGGAEGGRFFLKNCGFFNDFTTIGTFFKKDLPSERPMVDPERLP